MPLAAPVTRQTLPCSDGPILSEKKMSLIFCCSENDRRTWSEMNDEVLGLICSLFPRIPNAPCVRWNERYWILSLLYQNFADFWNKCMVWTWRKLQAAISVFWNTTVDIWMSPKSLANSFQYEHICFKGTQSMNINCSCLVRVSDPIQYFIWTNIINHSWRSEVIIVQKDSFWCDPGCSGEWVHTPWEGSRKDKAFIWTTIFYMTC